MTAWWRGGRGIATLTPSREWIQQRRVGCVTLSRCGGDLAGQVAANWRFRSAAPEQLRLGSDSE